MTETSKASMVTMKPLPKFTITMSYFAVLILNVCVLVGGRYIVEVELFGYSNPTQTCQDCRSGGQFANPGCCDRHDRGTCLDGDRCDSYFLYCLSTIDSSGRDCSYSGNRVSTVNMDDGSVDFNQSVVLDLENPLQLLGLTDVYEAGIQLYIEIQDRDDENDDDFIDVILINHTSPIGVKSGRQNHTGLFGFVTVDLTITVLCAQNFQGPDCTECTQSGLTGPNSNCDEIDNCAGVDCGIGMCVNGAVDSFSCTCDPGYTGEFCEDAVTTTEPVDGTTEPVDGTTEPVDGISESISDTSESMDVTFESIDVTSESMDDTSGRDIIGPIIGGVLGGLCVLLILILLIVIVIFVKILNYRKSRDKPAKSYTHQELVPTGHLVKTAINQMYDGSPIDEQDMDNLPLYEKVPDLKAVQYVNSPPDGTPRVGSVLVNNPIYGDENEKAKFETGDRFDGYDRTFQRPTPQTSDGYDRINLQVSIKENVAYSQMDSELEDNPLYGGEGGVNVPGEDGSNAESPYHQYDRTFQTPASGVNQEAKMSKVSSRPEEKEEEPTDKKHVYDYIDAKI